MAKSEKTKAPVDEEGVYDAESFLEKDLSELPDEASISGRWIIQLINGFGTRGVSNKGPWEKVTLLFNPVRPLSEDVELTDEQLENLPRVRTEMFVTTNAQQRGFVALAAKFNTAPGKASEMLADMKGEEIIATIKQVTNFRGELEYQASAFKELPFEEESESAAAA